MLHLDLFSGIGGFAYAADQVFGDVEHIFCDNEPFARAVLHKHWPESEIYDDIRTITADSDFIRRIHGRTEIKPAERRQQALGKFEPSTEPPFLLTGGFPCQPFSNAGLRAGTSDERYLWPEMLRVIRLSTPEWVIAENVSGILTLDDGVVFEQVCSDLETAGYEVQPFVIPAVAVNAPHRRDRVWFLAKNTSSKRTGGRVLGLGKSREGELKTKVQDERPDWTRNWAEVATELCGVDDGIPDRTHRIKALGNAIVPAVAVELMQGIRRANENL